MPRKSGWIACSRGSNDIATRFGAMHWEPAALLVDLVRRNQTIAAWERNKSG